MTTRKLAARLALATALSAVAFGEGGCATPGPLHVYSLASATAAEIRDDGPAPAMTVPSFLAPGETITGFAYDPFTDHFFLRLAPGNRIRVVDRPARAVKREFEAARAPATGGGDLAVRPRDGHLFLALPGEPALLELTRFGEFVRQIALDAPVVGVAFDTARDQLLTLDANRIRVTTRTPDGKPIATLTLAQPVTADALGYDAERRELYAPFADGREVGVFGDDGKLRRTQASEATLLDVGPRSFLRMF